MIIARFTSKITRHDWLLAKKIKRDLKASDICSDWDQTLIYINESSTFLERNIFKNVIEIAQKKILNPYGLLMVLPTCV